MEKIRLKVCNWNVATAQTLGLMARLSESGLFQHGRSPVYEILFKGLGANPHHTLFGEAPILALAFQSALTAAAKSPESPSVEELWGVLRRFPKFKEHFRVQVKGKDWTARLRFPKTRIKAQDWERFDWVALFDTGQGVESFRFAGSEFIRFLELFQRLNGTHNETEFLKAAGRSRALAQRFLAFAQVYGLLESPVRPVIKQARGVSQFELVSHSCLAVESTRACVLIDPAFLVPPPHHFSPGAFARMEEWTARFHTVDAVFITHHHWDHLHLPTLARVPRSARIYIPSPNRPRSGGLPFDPSIRDFLLSLGFRNIQELPWGERALMQDLQVTALPFYGEWFGPKSAFSAYSYQVKTPDLCLYGSVDGDRDERGNMKQRMKEIKTQLGHLDYFFFCSSSQTHQNPVYAGAPFSYSNSYGRTHRRWLRYHPDWKTVAQWCRTLRPMHAVPYAEFIFHNRRRRKPLSAAEATSSALDRFNRYWSHCIDDSESWLKLWRQDLESLNSALKPLGSRVLMLGPGEAVFSSASPSRPSAVPTKAARGRGQHARIAPDRIGVKGK